MVCLVYLVYLVCLVYLVRKHDSKLFETNEINQTNQRNETNPASRLSPRTPCLWPDFIRPGMNPFQGLWLIRVSNNFANGEVCVYGQGLKHVRCTTRGSCRPLSSLRRAHGAGASVRNRFDRLALCELRRTDRSRHSYASQAGTRACRSREAVRRPRETPPELSLAPSRTRGRRCLPSLSCQTRVQVNGRVCRRTDCCRRGPGLPCG